MQTQQYDEDEQYDIECGQISLNIPYKKIVSMSFKILKHTKVQNQSLFEIEIQYKCQGLMKMAKPINIQRKFSDFQWLANTLKVQSNRFLIVPKIQPFDQGTTTGALLGFVSGKIIQSKNDMKEEMDNQLRIKYQYIVIERFMKILTQVSLKFLYHKPGQFENTLFIFLQENHNFNFFRKIWQQQKKKGESVLQNYWNGLMDYIPTFTKRKSGQVHGLQPMQLKISKLYNKGSILIQKLKSHRVCIQTLSQNFIKKQNRQQLKLKMKKIDTFLYRLNECIRYSHLIMIEISQLIQFCQEIIEKSQKQVESYVLDQIKLYLDFVQNERTAITQKINKIGKQFMQISMKTQERVKIDIGAMYSNYQKVV